MSEAPGGTGSIGKLHRRDAVAILEMTRESALINQGEYCEAYGIPLKAFGNWRARFKAEPQPPARKVLYRRGVLSHALTETDTRPVLRGQQTTEKREVAFYVRAKTGPGPRDWSPVGVAFARKNDQPGFTVKLNTLPISGWNGAMVLVPPFADDDEPIDEKNFVTSGGLRVALIFYGNGDLALACLRTGGAESFA